ncbi:MAG: GmrSD restriction endonuclease domain-containing protein [Brevinema sp.]
MIKYIRPKSYQHYDGWTKETYEQYINSIGNLTLLEKKLNIKAKNEYLQKKQNTVYTESKIIDVNNTKTELRSLQEWTPSLCEKRKQNIITRLLTFFKNK